MLKRKKPRIFIINCFNDSNATRRGNRFSVPHQMTTIALAGVLNRNKIEISTHCEFLSGTFQDYKKLNLVDMLVLTGLNTAFDRMKQLTAYAKTFNPKIVVVMGGSIARVIPKLSSSFFDIVSEGDIEALVDIVDQAFSGNYGAEEVLPRYDLNNYPSHIGYAESSRNCNFRCHFCSMSAEDRKHFNYDHSYIERQLNCLGRPQAVMFLDQNFFAGPRSHFYQKIEMLHELYHSGRIKGWSALVTSDFFSDSKNLMLAKQAGCIGFFSGVETFNREQLASYKKRQNLILPQEKIIISSLEAGLMFHYGLMVDPTERKLSEIREEFDFVQNNDRITLPSFLSVAIPLLGTPLFRERIQSNQLLPNIRLRDMDGRSLVCEPIDDLKEAVELVSRLDYGYMKRTALAKRQWRFYHNYRKKLSFWGMASAMYSARAMAFPRTGPQGREDHILFKRKNEHLASHEQPGNLYRPKVRMAKKFSEYFKPLEVTNAQGQLHESLEMDLDARTESQAIIAEAV